MKLTKKEYSSDEEKRKDFWLGVAIFVTLNTLMALALFLLIRIQSQRGISSNGFFTFMYLLLNFLPYVINLGLLFYFALTRSQIALGMLAVLGFLIALALLAGILFAIFCFVSLFAGL